jgi:hypothetical protein
MPLGDEAFEGKATGMTKDSGPIAGNRLAELDAVTHRFGVAG